MTESASNSQEIHPLLNARPSNNPYRLAASQVFRRLKWDLNPLSWKSRRRLQQWRDQNTGGKCVILCNGPSLLEVDFDLLHSSGAFTFGLNKINLLFEKTFFRPSAVACVNRYVLEQNADFFNQTDLPLFLDSEGASLIKFRENVAFVHTSNQQKFARDCSISLTQGYTVTFVALQLAYHMGFRHVALVGCDHNFAVKGPANKAVVAGEKDESHFDPNYFSKGVTWELPDLAGSEYYYDMAGQVYAASGGMIYNCTEGGQLEIFPRMSLAQFLRAEKD